MNKLNNIAGIFVVLPSFSAGVITTYYYDGTTLIAEVTDDVIIMYLYDENNLPMGMMYRDGSYSSEYWDMYWYTKNLQGDITAVYDNEGNKLISYMYDAWGNIPRTVYSNGGASTPAVNNPFKYRGYYYDSDLKMYYLQTRYYDPVNCRFISPDAHVNANGDLVGFNMYAYCSNNPVNYTDPTGEFILALLSGLAGDFGTAFADIVASAATAFIINHIATGVVTIIANNRADEILSGGGFSQEAINKYFDKEYGNEKYVPRLEINGGIAFQIFNGDTISAIDRMALSKIFAESGLTDRSKASLAAEWQAHNIMTFLSNRQEPRYYNVDLDFDFYNNDSDAKLATILCMIAGFY